MKWKLSNVKQRDGGEFWERQNRSRTVITVTAVVKSDEGGEGNEAEDELEEENEREA
jgi:hypothetical protein